MPDRNAEQRGPKKEPRIFNDPKAIAEYQYLRSQMQRPITVVQLAGGTDVSIFKSFKPEDTVIWVENDEQRVSLVKKENVAKEGQIVTESSFTYRRTPPADMVVLRGAHIPREGENSEERFYENVDANLAEGGLLVTNHYKYQRDAEKFIQNKNYELVGVFADGKLTNVHNDEIKKDLLAKAKKTNDRGESEDKYAKTTFVFIKKPKQTESPRPAPVTPPAETHHEPAQQPAAQPEAHAETPEPVQSKPAEVKPPAATTEPTKPEIKPKETAPTPVAKVEEPKKEEKPTPTEASTSWAASTLKKIKKVVADLGFTIGGEFWTTMASAISAGAITFSILTGSSIVLLPALAVAAIPSAIGALINWDGIKKSASGLEKLIWGGSHIAASVAIGSPWTNIASAVTKFLGRQKYVPA